MDCGKNVFYKNGRFWVQHENGVDCVLLDLSAFRGQTGGRGPAGPAGPAGAGFNFGIDMTSDGVEGSGAPAQTITATPSAGAVAAYTYLFTLASRSTQAGQNDPTLTPGILNTAVIENVDGVSQFGLVKVRVTHIATGTIQEAEFWVWLGAAV